MSTFTANPGHSRALLHAAQQQATRFSAVAASRQPTISLRRLFRVWRETLEMLSVLALASAYVLGILVAVGAGLTAVSDSIPVQSEPHAPQPPADQAAGSTHVGRSEPTPAAAPSAAPPAQAAHGIVVAHGEIRIDLADVPLPEAARQLAAATQTELVGADTLHDSPRRISLKWQGRSATEAWQQMLVDDANYAVHCDTRRCQLWLLEGSASQRLAVSAATSTRTLARAPSASHTANFASAAPAARESAPPHAAAPQPDPKGLFPSEG